MSEGGSPPSVAQWIERAEHDLRTAEVAMSLTDDCPTDTVCYLAQQCAEKYLKALLIQRGRTAPRTHDLNRVVGRLPAVERTALAGLPLRELNPYIIEGRYPGDWDPMSRAEAEAAIAIAHEVRRIVRALLAGEAP